MTSFARVKLMQRRYAPRPQKSRRTAVLWTEESGRMRMLAGHACLSKTPSGVLYNRRIRLIKRFGLSAFVRDLRLC